MMLSRHPMVAGAGRHRRRNQSGGNHRPSSSNPLNPSPQTMMKYWEIIPPEGKEFILLDRHLDGKDGSISIQNLVSFWSSIPKFQAESCYAMVSETCWYLALVYLTKGAVKEARALTVNGAFLHQCRVNSIEHIQEICNTAQADTLSKLTICKEGFCATETSEKMSTFIHRHYSPPEKGQMFASSASSTAEGQMSCLSESWSSTPKKSQRDTISCGKTITLRFLQGQNNDEFTSRHQFVISTAAALKTVFTTYSDTRGISLKTLRFSYGGKILFLSQIKNKTPTEMCMEDMDVIIVEDTSCQFRDPRKAGSFEKKISISDNVVKFNQTKSSNGSKRKTARRNQATKHIQPNSSVADNVKTKEELKIKHSKQLTKVHEELHPHLKQIRQRLNNLVLDRSRPKRITRKPSENAATVTTQSFADKSYIGRKAGTPYFIINVGNTSNLYKTWKQTDSKSNSSSSSCICMPTLDLHGCTKNASTLALDANLPRWLNSAMTGSYPFVIHVKIICGGGNQILAEVVENWIRDNKPFVAHAPKSKHYSH